MEQYIRASRAQELGLLRMLPGEGERKAEVMVAALRALPRQDRPSEVVVPGLLEGLVSVNRLIEPWLTAPRAEAEAAATTNVVSRPA
jgi:predicted glycosyltransferase